MRLLKYLGTHLCCIRKSPRLNLFESVLQSRIGSIASKSRGNVHRRSSIHRRRLPDKIPEWESKETSMRKQSLAILLVAVFGLCIAPLWGQVEVGRVTGTVTDQSGALVNGAKVTLTNTSTGVVTTQTTSNGVYTFVAVQPGTYTVRVEATGFSAHITDNIVVNVQKTDTVDAQLNPGSVNEQVTVNTSTPLLQTETICH
jgi:hypothetical protein